MTGELGISFAPTQDQADQASRTGGLEGIPQAIKFLSLRMPRVLGARAPVNSALTSPQAGGGGIDPYLSAVMQSLMKALVPQAMPQQNMGMPSLPGGTAGPNPNPTAPYHSPGMPPSYDPGPGMPTRQPRGARTNFQELGDESGDTTYSALPDRPGFGEPQPYGRRGRGF